MKNEHKLMELTPKDMQCIIGSCPSIYEVTPKDMQCIAAACPAIEEYEGRYFIVGKIEDPEKFKDTGLDKKVGKGEGLFSAPKELIDNIRK